jgi:hypothetical protein
MGLRTALISLARAVCRPRLIVAAAVVAMPALLAPPAIDDASAQGTSRIQGSRGSFSGGGGPGRFANVPGGMTKAGRPGGRNVSNTPNPKGGMAGMRGRQPNPSGNTADTRRPKGEHRPPRLPRRPIYIPPPTFVALPGGPPPGPPANVSGGQPPLPPRSNPSAPPPTNWGRHVPHEVLVEVASNISPQAMTELMRRHRLTQLQAIDLQFSNTSLRRFRINDRRRSVPAVVRALAAEGFVVQPNLIATLQESAPARGRPSARDMEQYAFARMRMPEAHALATGQSVLIAVIDSGVDAQQPELAGLILDTFDAIGSGDRAHAHGTSIIGAIAARALLRGTAPSANILAARAFGPNRNSMDGNTADIVNALDWAMARGARIINMSFAGSRDPAIERRLAIARQRGIILVAAAGNAGPTSPPLFPAANPGVIAVTATDEEDRIFRGANRGNHIAVAAPGVGLWLPTVGGEYRITSGTSFSAAEITGVIALMLERNPNLTPDAVRRALVSTARDLGTPGMDPLFGAGLVDAYQAIMSVTPVAPAVAAPAASAATTETVSQ